MSKADGNSEDGSAERARYLLAARRRIPWWVWLLASLSALLVLLFCWMSMFNSEVP